MKRFIALISALILLIAPAHELAEKITGKVFEIDCAAEKVSGLSAKYRVINIAQTDAGVTLRVLSETAPEEPHREVAPTLEDYYLWVFGESSGN